VSFADNHVESQKLESLWGLCKELAAAGKASRHLPDSRFSKNAAQIPVALIRARMFPWILCQAYHAVAAILCQRFQLALNGSRILVTDDAQIVIVKQACPSSELAAKVGGSCLSSGIRRTGPASKPGLQFFGHDHVLDPSFSIAQSRAARAARFDHH